MEIPTTRCVAVLGVGLLGASVLMAAAARLPGVRRRAWSRSASSRALAADWAEVAASPAEACRGADLVVAACPVDALAGLLAEAAPGIDPAAVVTDVGSTKRGAHLAARALPRPGRFAGSHPMAGSEKGGAREGRADLFDGRACIVTESAETEPGAALTCARLWSALGARVHRMDPAAHDAAVAEISHLPHAAASVLAALLGARSPRTDLAAGGLRDTTRVAAGDPDLWVPILLENADHVAPLLRQLSAGSEALGAALARGDAAAVREILERGRSFRLGL